MDNDEEDRSNNGSNSGQLLGSIATTLAVTPLEVVKIRQQSAGPPPLHNIPPTSFREVKVSLYPAGCGAVVLNNGLMDCVLPVERTCLARSLPSLPASQSITKMGSGGMMGMLLSIFQNEGFRRYSEIRTTRICTGDCVRRWSIRCFTSRCTTRYRCRRGGIMQP